MIIQKILGARAVWIFLNYIRKWCKKLGTDIKDMNMQCLARTTLYFDTKRNKPKGRKPVFRYICRDVYGSCRLLDCRVRLILPYVHPLFFRTEHTSIIHLLKWPTYSLHNNSNEVINSPSPLELSASNSQQGDIVHVCFHFRLPRWWMAPLGSYCTMPEIWRNNKLKLIFTKKQCACFFDQQKTQTAI